MKKIMALLLSVLMIFSMTACGNTTDKEVGENDQVQNEEETNNGVEETDIVTSLSEPVEIVFWNAMSGVNADAIQKITDDFMAENPDIKVTIIAQGGYLDLFDKLMAAAKADQLPTMSQIYSNRLSWYVSKGLVENLNPYIENEEIGLSAESIADIPEMFLADGIWDGNQYAMPLNKSQMVLYYNVDMLNEAGVEVPTTWDEWKIASAKLTIDSDNDGDPEVYGTVFANNLSTDIAPWVKQAGGEIISEADDKVNFDTPETKEAVEFINGMIQAKSARLAGDDGYANSSLQQGRAAMCVASTSSLPYIEEAMKDGYNFNAAELPSYKTDDQLFYGTNVTIFNTATKEEKYAAWKYLKFLTNTENTAYFGSQTGYIPVRKSAKDVDIFKEVLEAKPIKQIPFECFDRGFQGARNIGEINALDVLGEELDQVFAGNKTIDEALKDAQERGTEAMMNARDN